MWWHGNDEAAAMVSSLRSREWRATTVMARQQGRRSGGGQEVGKEEDGGS